MPWGPLRSCWLAGRRLPWPAQGLPRRDLRQGACRLAWLGLAGLGGWGALCVARAGVRYEYSEYSTGTVRYRSYRRRTTRTSTVRVRAGAARRTSTRTVLVPRRRRTSTGTSSSKSCKQVRYAPDLTDGQIPIQSLAGQSRINRRMSYRTLQYS